MSSSSSSLVEEKQPWYKTKWFGWTWKIVLVILVIVLVIFLLMDPGYISPATIGLLPNTTAPPPGNNGTLLAQWNWKPSFLTSDISPRFDVEIYELSNCSTTNIGPLWKRFSTTNQWYTIGLKDGIGNGGQQLGDENIHPLDFPLDPTCPLYNGKGIMFQVRASNWLRSSSWVQGIYYPICIMSSTNDSTVAPPQDGSKCYNISAQPVLESSLNSGIYSWSYCGRDRSCIGQTGPTPLPGSLIWSGLPVSLPPFGPTADYSFQPFYYQPAQRDWTYLSAAGQTAAVACLLPGQGGFTGAGTNVPTWTRPEFNILTMPNSGVLATQTLPSGLSGTALIDYAKQNCLSTAGCVGFTINPSQGKMNMVCARQPLRYCNAAANECGGQWSWYGLQDRTRWPDSCG